MDTIQIRIDTKTKQSAQHVLDELGLDMTSAIRVYLKQIVLQTSLPLRLLTSNGLTPNEEQAILAASTEAKTGMNVTKPMSVKAALKYLDTL
ncbi:MAG: type II toxin-antitoxin system RelB/DinJ family antitoxin [Patescibacteria group bacterium]|jgi:DNA-damage-inducible protein J